MNPVVQLIGNPVSLNVFRACMLLVNLKWYVCFPARLLMIDLSQPFSTDVGHDVCEALENMFSLACNLSGPTRIPFFGVMALYNYPEVTPTMKSYIL